LPTLSVKQGVVALTGRNTTGPSDVTKVTCVYVFVGY